MDIIHTLKYSNEILLHFSCSERMIKLIQEEIHIHYALLPYYYTLFREASVSGDPIMCPLWMEFPNNELTFSNDEAFIIGGNLLV